MRVWPEEEQEEEEEGRERVVGLGWVSTALSREKLNFNESFEAVRKRLCLVKPPRATQEINSWAENETSGLVKDFIHEGLLSNSVKFVITNAIHFKGAWKGKSYIPRISRRPQERNENLEMDPSMSAKGNAFKDLKMVYQPLKMQSKYDYERFSMLFCFPLKDTDRARIEHVTETLKNLCGHQEIPKFNISSEVEVSETLRGVGVTLPSSGGKWKGMFSSFGVGRKLYVSSIFQKSFMEIIEQGTEVVSVTAAVVMSGCPPCLPPVPTLEHKHIHPLHIYDGTTAKTDSVIINLIDVIK
ncbi:serpin-ZX-like [Neltuma alba]|uniref:serpin-ZX-like n=1 Tax=Neltuma alba TaxID=207710 RepID=UPI0010A44077|nr:serpin-ZX-like [Prosopis alba]